MPTQEPPEITQLHIDIAVSVAFALSHTSMGNLAGQDELESQSMVALWDLALSYDASMGTTFDIYVKTYLRRRLIDWVRIAYGRAKHDEQSPRMVQNLAMASLDWFMDSDHATAANPALIDRRPGPEETTLARLELQELGALIRTLEPYDQELMLAGVYEEPLSAIAARWGQDRHTFGAARHWRKNQVKKALGRV